MSRTLRLGFAMGGGVSLGSFQGGALSQAIKLAVAHSKYKDANGNSIPYDDVVLDVFSGASAGAMTLAIMLASLLNITEKQKQAAETNLRADPQIGSAVFDSAPPKVRENLVAAQLIQDRQREVWTQRLQIRELVGRGSGTPRTLIDDASLLNRGLLEKLAKEYLLGKQSITYRAPLLAKRALFACTLSNLTPIITDARTDIAGSSFGYVALRDGLRCKVHRELRVFDLFFGDINNSVDKDQLPERWYRLTSAPLPGGIAPPQWLLRGDLNTDNAWKTIAATSIACGAFPFAFEPVSLTRFREEFGGTWPFDQEKTEHVFTYIDGGTFNNEPIRQAFRLASYVDSLTPSEDFDRRIIFCTPFSASEDASYLLPVHQCVDFPETHPLLSDRRLQPQLRTTMDRLAPHVATVISTLTDEGRNQEDDKIFMIRNRFRERDQRREFIDISLAAPTTQSFRALINYCTATLANDARNSIIPPTPLGLDGELQRVYWEWVLACKAAPRQHPVPTLDPTAQALRDKVRLFLDPSTDVAKLADSPLWFLLLSFVALDLLLDLNGKSRDAELIAVGPFDDMKLEPVLDRLTGKQKTDPDSGDPLLDPQTQRPLIDPGTGEVRKTNLKPLMAPTAKPILLRAGDIGAFGGFLSASAMNTAFDVGAYCARNFMSLAELIDLPASLNAPPASVATQNDSFFNEAADTIHYLADRVGEVVMNTKLFSLPIFDSTVKSVIAGFARDKVMKLTTAPPDGTFYELRVYPPVSQQDLLLAADSVGDVTTVSIRNAGIRPTPALITFGRHQSGEWYLGNLFGTGDSLQINSPGTLGVHVFEKPFCHCELPDLSQFPGVDFASYPIFALSLAASDLQTTVPANRWQLESAAAPLDQVLGM